jgi:hypothetical protein
MLFIGMIAVVRQKMKIAEVTDLGYSESYLFLFLRVFPAAVVIIFFLEFFAFFGSHCGKLRFKPMPPVVMCPAAMPPSAKAAEQNMREDKQPDRLPECEEWPVEKIGDKSIP